MNAFAVIEGMVTNVGERQAGQRKVGTVVIETARDDSRTNPVCVECWKWPLPSFVATGAVVVCACQVRGREYQGRHYVSIVADRFGVVATAGGQEPRERERAAGRADGNGANVAAPACQPARGGDDADELPF